MLIFHHSARLRTGRALHPVPFSHNIQVAMISHPRTRLQVLAQNRPRHQLNPAANEFTSSSWNGDQMSRNMTNQSFDKQTHQNDLQSVSQSLRKVSIDNHPTPQSQSKVFQGEKKKIKKPLKSQSQMSDPPTVSAVSFLPNHKNTRDKKVRPSKASGGVPNPTTAYLATSHKVPQLLPEPQHLLVVIDLNGTLLHRPNKKNPTKFQLRPNTTKFLKYCIDTFTVVIWSSARPENVLNMCQTILPKDLLEKVTAIWGRDKFGLTSEEYLLRVQCYKRLTKLWNDPQIALSHPEYQSGGRWGQINTVLMDDSQEKARSEPFNLIQVPEFVGNDKETGEILPQVHDHLNHLSMHSNVSACLRAHPFKPLSMCIDSAEVEHLKYR
jgi:hypothetical protein